MDRNESKGEPMVCVSHILQDNFLKSEIFAASLALPN